MHGITRTQNLKHNDPSAIEFVRRITIRYADGRVLRFKPMVGRYFSEDDTRQLVRIIMRASSTAEWRDINTRLGF